MCCFGNRYCICMIATMLHHRRTTNNTTASGENMNANEFCEATFGFKGKQVVHRMYVLDKLACHQKLLLGMDFMRRQRLNIDMATDIITLPEVQECTPLMSMQALCIVPQNTV